MRMRPLHARYPSFAAAREAIGSADVATATLVAEDAPAVERGVERVKRVFMKGTVEPNPGKVYPWETKTELLLYPILRITTSLAETPAAVDKHARAEVDMPYERIFADFDADDDDIYSEARASLDDLPHEFNLDGAVRAESNRNRNSRHALDNYWADAGPYLTYSDTDWGTDWRLVSRSLAGGAVRVIREELSELLRGAVRCRVAEGLPFTVHSSDAGDRLTDALRPHVECLRSLLSDCGAVNVVYVDAADPDHFPSCVGALLARA